jgi:hypothetical protein
MAHMGRNRAGVVLVAVCASVLTSATVGAAQRLSAPRLARSPYLGVACPKPANSCGRIGVAVWLAAPATSIDVTLLGRKVHLSTSHSGTGAYGYRRHWTGFIHLPPAQVRPGTSDVRVRISVVGGGTTVNFTRFAYLSAGWG